MTHQESLLVTELIAAREKAGKTQRQVSNLLGRAHNFCHFVETNERRLDVWEFIEYVHALDARASEIVRRLEKEVRS